MFFATRLQFDRSARPILEPLDGMPFRRAVIFDARIRSIVGFSHPLMAGLALLLAFLSGFSVLPSGLAAENVETAPSPQSAEAGVSFELDVQPILTSRGCNAGACHGKARGQNGFALSLLGFDPDFDYDSLTKHSRGRRLFPAAVERSLLLRKATAETPHGGGRRIEPGGDDYETLRRWIRQGAPRSLPGEPHLVRIELSESQTFLAAGESRQLLVTAHYSDGTAREVTRLSTFLSNESAVASVSKEGVITAGKLPGEAAIMARYMSLIAVCNVAIPVTGAPPAESFASLPRRNFIDELVWKKLASLGAPPSAPADDSKFLRRASIDLIGRLPSPDEARAFLEDASEDKRARLIDRLLDRPEYADHWAAKWMDLLRPNPYRVGIKAVLNYDNWIRQQFRENRPYDEFVRDLITARGSTWRNGATTLFRDRRSPDEIATLVSQLFLGIRLECAKCHHHPFEKWSQEDFYSFAAHFAQIDTKGTGLSPPISGGEEMIVSSGKGEVTHPITRKVLPPRRLYELAFALGVGEREQATATSAAEDPRAQLADWLTSRQNPFFSRVLVNRVWSDLMGRGLVEPVDDLRITNPSSNEELLSALAEDFANNGFDLKHLLRTIATSYVYALSSLPNEQNVTDTRNYSRHYRQQLRAEVLYDAVRDCLEGEVRFDAMPAGARASQLWTHRIDSLFLDTFGRPDENQDPPCERISDGSVTQSLHLMNSPELFGMASRNEGRAARLAASSLSVDEVIRELYLAAYCRFPQDEELEIGRQHFAVTGDRRQATEDLLWALLNTPEFFFKD